MPFGFEAIVIACMLVVNALFATYEMALASMSHARLSTLCHEKKRGAEHARFMKEKMEASLAFIQLGITLSAAIAAATGGAGVQQYFTPYLKELFGLPPVLAETLAVICFVIPLSSVTIIFGELVPKMFGLSNKEWVCLAFSPVMMFLARLTSPVVIFFEKIVKFIMGTHRKSHQPGTLDMKESLHEIKAAAALAKTSHLIGAHEERIMLSAAQLVRRSVGDIFLPVGDISMIPASASLSDALIKAHLDMHTRFPVCRDEADPESIMGYVNFKDIVNALKLNPENPTVEGIIRPIKKIPAETSLSQLLSEMIRERAHIALVISKTEKVLGMVTLEDILEELVGEIEDEYDRLPTHLYPFGSSWAVGGSASMDALSNLLHKPLEFKKTTGHPAHFAAWVEERLGRLPEKGEVLEIEGLKITVRKLRRKRLCDAVVEVMSA